MTITRHRHLLFCFFFFNDTATTEIYTLSLHDALPIFSRICGRMGLMRDWKAPNSAASTARWLSGASSSSTNCRSTNLARTRRSSVRRSEEHTSELQSRLHLVCRLLLEKKKNDNHSSSSLAFLFFFF